MSFKVAVIGNCQAEPLAKCFRRSELIDVVALFDINKRLSAEYKENQTRLIRKELELDFVLTQPISDKFDVETANLKQIYGDKIVTFTNVFFDGIHPDMTYFSYSKGKLQSPLGDYNSKVAIAGFLKGYSVDETLKRYNGKTYEAFGYFKRFADSGRGLLDRDQSNDVKFASEFLDMSKKELTLYALNHPTASVIMALAKRIAERLGRTMPEFPVHFFGNNLSDSSIWPVYPEVAEHHRLPYQTSMRFWGTKAYTPRQFVERSFKSYSEVGIEEMRAAPLGKQILAQISSW